MTRYIYLWAGPGAGKSTLAADIFQAGKRLGKSIEMVREYAKELVWEGRPLDQLALFAEQTRREASLSGNVDFVVTDSPAALGVIYSQFYGSSPWLVSAIRDAACDWRRRTHIIDVVVARTKNFVQAGRNEDEQTARHLDGRLEAYLQTQAWTHLYQVTSATTGQDFWSLINPSVM